MKRIADKFFMIYSFLIFAFLFIPIIVMVLFSSRTVAMESFWSKKTSQ